MSFKHLLAILIALTIGFVVGYLSQPRPIIDNTTTVIDSTRYEFPSRFEVKSTEIRSFSIPKLVFAPQDTTTIVVTEYIKGDSVDIELPFERREYRDSTYRAIVSGVVVDDIHPTLESLDIYSKTTTSIIEKKPPLFAPYVSASIGDNIFGVGGGISIRAKHDLGVKFWQTSGEPKLTFEYAYRF
jgi:hypothetical protein